PPSAEGDPVRTQGLAVSVFDEPVGVLPKQVRLFFGDKRRNPDGRLESTLTNFAEHALHVAAKRRARLRPIAHCGLVPVVYLNVLQPRRVFGDEVQIVAHLLRRYARPEAVPRTPARRRSLESQWRMVRGQALRQLIQ